MPPSSVAPVDHTGREHYPFWWRRRAVTLIGDAIVFERVPTDEELFLRHPMTIIGNRELLSRLSIGPMNVHSRGEGIPRIGDQLH